MPSKIITSPVVSLPDSARDAYQFAQMRRIPIHEAASQIEREGWQFVGYNDYGQAAYVPPKGKR